MSNRRTKAHVQGRGRSQREMALDMAEDRRAKTGEFREGATNHDWYVKTRDKFIKSHHLKAGPWQRLMMSEITHIETNQKGIGRVYMWSLQLSYVGAWAGMEETTRMVEVARDELEQAKHELEEMVNRVKVLTDVLNPALVAHAKQIHTHRMTMVSEVNSLLAPMRDIRKFFFDKDYEVEMQRLERFVALCRDMQQLREDGVLDALIDSSIRLAVREVDNDVGKQG